MQSEQQDILNFLSGTSPFHFLEEPLMEEVLNSLQIEYFKSGNAVLHLDQPAEFWYIIRKGAVEVFRRDGELYNRLGPKGYFGEFGLLMGRKVRFPVKAIEDTLCYLIPQAVFQNLFEQCESFADYVEIEDNTRLKKAASSSQSNNLLLSAKVSSLVSGPALLLPGSTSAMQAAKLMTESGQTSVLVTSADGSRPTGIVTDADFRSKLVAEGLNLSTPLQEILTAHPVVLSHDRPAFEALSVMLRTGAHHLPVTCDGQILGIVSQTDLIRHQSRSALFITNSISQSNSVEELAMLKPEAAQSFIKLVEEDANSRMIGTAIASIGRSFKQRLLELAEKQFGPPPVEYCFLALGSMAREEQLLATDQDNAIVLGDTYEESAHGEYFRNLAKFVCDGLNLCGYSYCSGNIMATNPEWTRTLKSWEALFTQWITKPSAAGLLNSNVFFDLEGVWGARHLAESLDRVIARLSKSNAAFLACMSRNALLRKPPLGFFKDFVVEKDGSHINTINMKNRGSGPLTDLIRVHALAAGSRTRNSFVRLTEIDKAGGLLPGQAANIRDALEVVSMVRIKHQAQAAARGVTPNNQVDPGRLGVLERRNLKDSFQILSDAQQYLKFRFQSSSRG